MLRVFLWDGKEVFINADTVLFVEFMSGGGYDRDFTQVTMTDGKNYRLSGTSYDILTGHSSPTRGQGRAGFDVI